MDNDTKSRFDGWFWLFLGVFALVWLALRVPWITADPGVPALWEYGYNATDEGYYLGGGKEKLLWGAFVNLPRMEAFTYGFSPLTHGLSYLAHLAFGLSTWTWRLPFMAINLLAWLAMFVHVARRSGAGAALAFCLSVSCLPLVVAYERTASNDVLIGSLLVLAYVFAAGGGGIRFLLAALLTGAIGAVKPSVWALLPIVAAGVLEAPPHGAGARAAPAWRRLALFAGAAVAAVLLGQLAAVWAVRPDAAKAGVSAWEIVRRTRTQGIPALPDLAAAFRGFASFPRDPSGVMLGVGALLVSAVPFALAVRGVARRRWNGRTLLFTAVAAYTAAIATIPTHYTHYYLPVLMMLPAVFAAMGTELEADRAAAPRPAPGGRRLALAFGLPLAVLAAALPFLLAHTPKPQALQAVYARVFNLPAQNAWTLTGPHILLFAAGAALTATLLRGLAAARRYAAAWFLAAAAAGSVAFALLPAAQFAPYLRQPAAHYAAPMAAALAVAAVFLVAVFGLGDALPWRRALPVAVPVCLAACCAAAPTGRQAVAQLLAPGTHRHAAAARELAAVLPPRAIVIGERSSQMLMSLPVRAATTFASCSDPIPVIADILRDEPDAPLYALVDTQHAYNLRHYREHAAEYALRPVKTLRMPSFADGSPTDVHLCEIAVRTRPAAPLRR